MSERSYKPCLVTKVAKACGAIPECGRARTEQVERSWPVLEYIAAFHDKSIRFRIFSLVGLLLVMGAASSVFGILKMNGLGHELVAIAEEDMPLTESLTRITVHQLEQAVLFERAFRLGEVGDLNDHIAALSAAARSSRAPSPAY